MSRNLKFQYLTCIESNFIEGQQKHSIKKQKNMNNTRIFSYADRKNLINVFSNFSNYMRKNHTGIKQVKNVKTEHIQAFLYVKQSEGVSQETLKTYTSAFRKMQNLVNATYNAHVDYSSIITPISMRSNKLRSNSMCDTHFNTLYNTFKEDSPTAIALQMSFRSGLRVEETSKIKAKSIDLEHKCIHIVDGKGKKNRTIPMLTGDDFKYYSDLKAKFNDNDRLVSLQKDSINRNINRHLKSLSLKQNYSKTSIHSIRKNFAQRYFDKLRHDEMNTKESLSMVSLALGHGHDRAEKDNCIQQYVLNIY